MQGLHDFLVKVVVQVLHGLAKQFSIPEPLKIDKINSAKRNDVPRPETEESTKERCDLAEKLKCKVKDPNNTQLQVGITHLPRTILPLSCA